MPVNRLHYPGMGQPQPDRLCYPGVGQLWPILAGPSCTIQPVPLLPPTCRHSTGPASPPRPTNDLTTPRWPVFTPSWRPYFSAPGVPISAPTWTEFTSAAQHRLRPRPNQLPRADTVGPASTRPGLGRLHLRLGMYKLVPTSLLQVGRHLRRLVWPAWSPLLKDVSSSD
jgi:hypothetical protein